MIGWVLGIAAVGLGFLGYKKFLAPNPAAKLLDFQPFTLKSNGLYSIRVLAPTEMDSQVRQMFKPDVAVVSLVSREGGPQTVPGPTGAKEFQVYLAKTLWLAADAGFSQPAAVVKMGLTKGVGTTDARALAAALYDAASAPAGSEKRLRFFPVAIVESIPLGISIPLPGTPAASGFVRGVG